MSNRAYILFYDKQRNVLLGQETYGSKRFTNLGGGKKVIDHNQPMRTAVRELLEELFGWSFNVNNIDLIDYCLDVFHSIHGYEYINQTFVNYFLPVSILEKLLQHLSHFSTHLYHTFPITIEQLVHKRLVDPHEEIGILRWFSLDQPIPSVNKHVLTNLKILSTLLSNK